MVVLKNLAIIPARSGSKRIVGKNKINFRGQPLFVWTLIAAIDSGIFDRVVVSTDDLEIREIALSLGASVPTLRESYSDDYSPVSLATIETVVASEKYFNESYLNIFQLLPTSPLRTSQDIICAFEEFQKRECKFLISVAKYSWQNPWWAIRLNKNQKADFLFDDVNLKRSQDLETLYAPSGAIWIAKKEDLLYSKSFYGEGFEIFVLDFDTAIDIDTDDDLLLAELLANADKTKRGLLHKK